MAMIKKINIFLLSFSLMLTVSFPSVIKTVEAAPTPENSIYYVEVEELRGRSSIGQLLAGVILGLITDVKFTFFNTKLKNMTLKKLVHTDNGPMVVTMRSERPNELIEAGTLNIESRELSFNFLRTLLRLPNLLIPGTVYDVKANIVELDSSRIQINDLVVDVSFDPIEVKRLEEMQRAVTEIDPKDKIEENILALDEKEGGKLSQQKEEYEAMLQDLPNQEEAVHAVKEMLDEAEKQSSEIDASLSEIQDLLTDENGNHEEIDKQVETIVQQIENFASMLEEISVSIDEIQEILIKYIELIDLRIQYLSELGLVDWSKSYQAAVEVKKALQTIIGELEKHIERFNQLNEQKDDFEVRLNQMKELIANLNANVQETMTQQDESEETQTEESERTEGKPEKKQLNGKLEEFQENEEEPTLLETILEEEEISDDIDIEHLQEEFDAILTEKAEEIEKFASDEEKQKAMAKAIKEILAQYSPILIKYLEKMNEEKQQLLENMDENNEQIADLEIRITIIENIIARIEEFDEELLTIVE